MDATQDIYTLQIALIPDARPVKARLGLWLKAGLRQHGIRCTSISPGPGTASPAGQERRSDMPKGDTHGNR